MCQLKKQMDKFLNRACACDTLSPLVETRVVDKSDTLQVQLTMTEAFLKIKLFFVLGYRCIVSGNLTNSYIQIGFHLSSLSVQEKKLKKKKFRQRGDVRIQLTSNPFSHFIIGPIYP